MVLNRLISAILAVSVSLVFTGAGFSKNLPKLNIDKIELTDSVKNQRSVERSFHEGEIVYRIPEEFTDVEIASEEKSGIFNVDADDCNAFFLNGLTGEQDSEVLCLFFFEFDKYLKYETDSSEVRGVERAIIDNIAPGELNWFDRFNPVSISTKTSSEGRKFDYYVATYGAHKVEFVFTKVTGGMFVVMYIYNNSYTFVDDILFIMHSITGKGE